MTEHVKMSDLLKSKALVVEKAAALNDKPDFDEATDGPAFEKLVEEAKSIDSKIERLNKVRELSASKAQPVSEGMPKVPATVENDSYIKDKSLVLGGVMKMLGAGGGNVFNGRLASEEIYGAEHPVTKALQTTLGSAGGFLVPQDIMADIIPLLRANAVVRASNPMVIPMPRGTMTLPGQASGASAGYGAEGRAITQSQPGLNAIVAAYKKLTALVPISNDMMRYANAAVDQLVRNDLLKVIGLREDLAFLMGDGTQDSPRGLLSFANSYASANGGSVSALSTTANSVAASGGNFLTSQANYTLNSVTQELGKLISALDQVNAPNSNRYWYMSPRTKNYLLNVQNGTGFYVFQDEMKGGTLLGYPFKTTTQILNTYWDVSGSNKDCSLLILADMSEAMILDSMQMQISVSSEASYVDSTGATISSFQADQTLMRSISEHDFQMRHDASIAINQFVRWGA